MQFFKWHMKDIPITRRNAYTKNKFDEALSSQINFPHALNTSKEIKKIDKWEEHVYVKTLMESSSVTFSPFVMIQIHLLHLITRWYTKLMRDLKPSSKNGYIKIFCIL